MLQTKGRKLSAKIQRAYLAGRHDAEKPVGGPLDDLPITTIQDRRRRCTEKTCNRRARSRGLCTKHYQQARAKGQLEQITGADHRRLFRYRKEPTETDAAYLAGYFDGAGTFEVTSRGQRWYVAVYYNRPQHAVLRTAEIYGGSVRISATRTKSHRFQFRYYLAQQQAVDRFLKDIRPYLIEKAEEVDLLFREFSSAMSAEKESALRQALTALRNQVCSQATER